MFQNKANELKCQAHHIDVVIEERGHFITYVGIEPLDFM